MLVCTYDNRIDEIQVGIDEAGRGCMIGPVYAAAVIWNNEIDASEIKDSKKITRKKRSVIKKYIEENALAYGIGYATNEEIDNVNILNATYLAMHRALDQITIPFNRILVDGDKFKPYKCNIHTCIVGGDNKYINIAAASILAKEYHDEWILNTFRDNDLYDLTNNRGYGTRKHFEALRKFGINTFHRKSFCKKFI